MFYTNENITTFDTKPSVKTEMLTADANNYAQHESIDRRATVKTAEYTLDEGDGAHLEQTGKNRAKATVTLHKTETPFSAFAKKSVDHASFIKKTYTLRFNDDAGWQVTD